MKFVLFVTVFILAPSMGFSAIPSNPTSAASCLEISDGLDREHCTKKATRNIKTSVSKDYARVKKKAKKSTAKRFKKKMDVNIARINNMIQALESEKAIYSRYKAKAGKIKIKKKKTKSDLEKVLGL